MRFSAHFFSPAIAAIAVLLVPTAFAAMPACATLDEIEMRPSHDVCISAFVYDVVTVEDGTRFLDLCSPETTDAQCRFSVVSYSADRSSVGDLRPLSGKTVEVRGAIQKFGRRYVLVLNDEGQLHHQAPRFRPDPRLLAGFSVEDSQPRNAPELKVNFHHHGKKLEHE